MSAPNSNNTGEEYNKKDRMITPKFDERKFKELILYITLRCKFDPYFGTVKLNKILFLSDVLAYAGSGQAITGAEYIALDYGPAPKLLIPILADMERNGDIKVRRTPLYGYEQERIVALMEISDLKLFTSEDIVLVDTVIDIVRPMTATQLREYTHHMYGWKVAPYKGVIPYQAIFLADEQEATASDRERARELAENHGW